MAVNDKVVMITGAASGIGRELCLGLAAKYGYRIIAAARRIDRLESLCHEINGFGFGSGSGLGPGSSSPDPKPETARAVAVELDVSAGSAAIEASMEKAWGAFGEIDVLVNNAGIRGGVYSPLDLPEEEWESTLRSNLTGLWLVSKHVCKRMRDAKIKGSVINISSVAGLERGQKPCGIAYTASKTGVIAITRTMALELGKYNIRVNAIAPGLFKSEMTKGLVQKNLLNNVTMKSFPLRTHGMSDPALTSLVRHLIHDSSNYVTGNIFIVDSGATLPGVPIFSSL